MTIEPSSVSEYPVRGASEMIEDAEPRNFVVKAKIQRVNAEGIPVVDFNISWQFPLEPSPNFLAQFVPYLFDCRALNPYNHQIVVNLTTPGLMVRNCFVACQCDMYALVCVVGSGRLL